MHLHRLELEVWRRKRVAARVYASCLTSTQQFSSHLGVPDYLQTCSELHVWEKGHAFGPRAELALAFIHLEACWPIFYCCYYRAAYLHNFSKCCQWGSASWVEKRSPWQEEQSVAIIDKYCLPLDSAQKNLAGTASLWDLFWSAEMPAAESAASKELPWRLRKLE